MSKLRQLAQDSEPGLAEIIRTIKEVDINVIAELTESLSEIKKIYEEDSSSELIIMCDKKANKAREITD